MSQPQRIQMTRKRPWRHLAPDAIRVDRRSPWGNPHALTPHPCQVPECRGAVHQRDECLRLFRAYLDENPELVERARRELRGQDLACWCPLDTPCHADIWLEIVNHLIRPEVIERKEAR